MEPKHRHFIGLRSTYTPPIIIINMTLLQRPLDLLLPLLRQIYIPIKHLKVAIDQILNIRNDLWCNATPLLYVSGQLYRMKSARKYQ
jgi:hypothetical protein